MSGMTVAEAEAICGPELTARIYADAQTADPPPDHVLDLIGRLLGGPPLTRAAAEAA